VLTLDRAERRADRHLLKEMLDAIAFFPDKERRKRRGGGASSLSHGRKSAWTHSTPAF
jgi:hypothetical protein